MREFVEFCDVWYSVALGQASVNIKREFQVRDSSGILAADRTTGAFTE
jgi:hypothetical protein